MSEIESTSQRAPCLPASPALIDFSITSLVVSVLELYLTPFAAKGLMGEIFSVLREFPKRVHEDKPCKIDFNPYYKIKSIPKTIFCPGLKKETLFATHFTLFNKMFLALQ